MNLKQAHDKLVQEYNHEGTIRRVAWDPVIADIFFKDCRMHTLFKIDYYDAIAEDWFVQPLPKEKVVRFLWAYRDKASPNHVLTSKLLSKQEFLDTLDSHAVPGSIQRLGWSATEFTE